jgi:hypothetical protein
MGDTHGAHGIGWIGVDLDGTLAKYNGWIGPEHIGEPIPKMLQRVDQWIKEGKRVKIMTARVSPAKNDADFCRKVIQTWLGHHVGCVLEITHEKDHLMLELWDDRVVQVIPNTGERADGRPE